MSITPVDRKILLMKAGKTQVDVADECGVDPSLVTHVIAGRKLTSPAAQKVMEHIAHLAGLQISEVFPVEQPEPEPA